MGLAAPGSLSLAYKSVQCTECTKAGLQLFILKNEDKLNKAVNLVPHTRKRMFWVNYRGMCRKVMDYATSPNRDLKEHLPHTPWEVTDPSQKQLCLVTVAASLALPQGCGATQHRKGCGARHTGRQLCRHTILGIT